MDTTEDILSVQSGGGFLKDDWSLSKEDVETLCNILQISLTDEEWHDFTSRINMLVHFLISSKNVSRKCSKMFFEHVSKRKKDQPRKIITQVQKEIGLLLQKIEAKEPIIAIVEKLHPATKSLIRFQWKELYFGKSENRPQLTKLLKFGSEEDMARAIKLAIENINLEIKSGADFTLYNQVISNLGDIYQEYTHKTPKRNYNAIDTKESGWFLEFVTEFFKLCGIENTSFSGLVRSYTESLKR